MSPLETLYTGQEGAVGFIINDRVIATNIAELGGYFSITSLPADATIGGILFSCIHAV